MNNKLFLILIILVASFAFTDFVFASTTNGTVSGYAWGNNIGWINFGCTNCSVSVTDTLVTGHAWSDNYGWIKLNPANSGVANNNEGTLSAKAWGENIGWINFSGVTISSAGVFSGTASVDEGGSINFGCTNCNMTTDWRPASSRTTTNASVSGGGSTLPPAFSYSILIQNGQQYINSQTVQLYLDGGSDAKKMEISNSPDFLDAQKEEYVKTKAWILSQGDGQKTVYAKFYTKYDIPSNVVSDNIILDTKPPEIKITYIKDIYGAGESVIINGATEPNVDVSLAFDQQYGLLKADSQGNFIANLGILTSGSHALAFGATDLAYNIGVPAMVTVLVGAAKVVAQIPVSNPILDKIKEGIKDILPDILKPKEPPKPVVTVPKTVPLTLQGKWRIFPVTPLERFVLAPLPQDIRILAQALPQLDKTFTKVGVKKMTDLEKLRVSNIKLPPLAQAVNLPPVEISPGKFVPVKNVPLARLSSEIKQTIPFEVVFIKTASGLVDLNVALSVDNKGTINQSIQTIAGKSLQLIVKPKFSVKSVKGYVVFKSKKPRQISKIPASALAASFLFSNPVLTTNLIPNNQVTIEGASILPKPIILPVPSNSGQQSNNIEERLVLMQFNYTDIGDGLYVANVETPVVDGQYEIITTIEYVNPVINSKEIKLITLVDPEGYIYEKNGMQETRITGAVVSLYWQNPATNQYELWNAKDFLQENPQITDVRGTYSFLVPNGYYYLKVDSPGYRNYNGKVFEIKEGSGVHTNIELKDSYWWFKILDWKTMLLVIVTILLLFNFYRDKIRNRVITVQ